MLLGKPTCGQRNAAAVIWICPETNCVRGGVPPPPCRGSAPHRVRLRRRRCLPVAAAGAIAVPSAEKNHKKVRLPCWTSQTFLLEVSGPAVHGCIIAALCQVRKELGQGGAEVPKYLEIAFNKGDLRAATDAVASCSEFHKHTRATASAPSLGRKLPLSHKRWHKQQLTGDNAVL